MTSKCICCNKTDYKVIWNKKIRTGKNISYKYLELPVITFE